jgi:hypothetical protein
MKFDEKTILQTITVISILLAASSSTITSMFSKLSPSLAIIIPAGIFVLLYKAVIFIYKHLLWKKIHKDKNLSGLWVFFTTDSENKLKAFGKFYINHSSDELNLIEGKSWFINDKAATQTLRSVFSSKSAVYDNGELAVFYDTKNPKEGSFMGAMRLVASETPPESLNGVYTSFTNPKKINGEVHAKKYTSSKIADSELKNIVIKEFSIEGIPISS